jgi:hypothetical protein
MDDLWRAQFEAAERKYRETPTMRHEPNIEG